jgi:rhodanese-related sulfurtransferase
MNFITASSLRQKIENNELLTLIDLRSGSLFHEGTLPDAINRPLLLLKPVEIKKLVQKNFLFETPVVLICENGQKSRQAAKLLETVGLEDIMILEGGYRAWQSHSEEISQLPINHSENVPEITTRKIYHLYPLQWIIIGVAASSALGLFLYWQFYMITLCLLAYLFQRLGESNDV